jgi:hypothetical protein
MNTPKNIVDAVIELTTINRKAKELGKRMNELKELIRPYAIEVYGEARKGTPDLTMIEIPSTAGTLSVIFPRDVPKIIKGTDPNLVKMKLPLEKWNMAFVEEVSIKKEFSDSWTAEPCPFTKAERNLISKVIRFEEATPRIEPAK